MKSGTRVALDMTTLTIMRYLPREVDPLVYNMSHEDPGDVTYSEIGKIYLNKCLNQMSSVLLMNSYFPIVIQMVKVV